MIERYYQELVGFFSRSLGDRDSARLLAHALKGSAGNLGAVGVQLAATELETAIKDESDTETIKRLTDILEIELRRVISGIRAQLPALEEQPWVGKIDWVTVRQVLSELVPLLETGNTRTGQLVESHAALLAAALGPSCSVLRRQIADFLFPEALETLKQARDECPELTNEK